MTSSHTTQSNKMPALLPNVDPDGLLEYSVVYTDRALNHMSVNFQQVMKDLSSSLKRTYNADKVAIIPGSGTYGMEAVARQLATGKHVIVIRNGWFSYRLVGLAISCDNFPRTPPRPSTREAPPIFAPPSSLRQPSPGAGCPNLHPPSLQKLMYPSQHAMSALSWGHRSGLPCPRHAMH